MTKATLKVITAFTLLMALSAVTIRAQAAGITDEGATTPIIGIDDILTGDSTAGNLGVRPIQWDDALIRHAARGQSFTFSGTGDYTLNAVWVQVSGDEDFSAWTTDTLHMDILSSPTVRSSTPLGIFDYDATGLGTVSDGSWLRLDLDSGVTVTAGTEYSFLLTAGADNGALILNLTRQKTAGVYTGGSELNAANAYDIANRDTDPWDDNDPIGSSVGTSGSNLYFYIEAVAVPEPSTFGLLGVFGGMLILVRRSIRK